MKLNAYLHHKQSEYNTNLCAVEKIIEIPQYEFLSLCRAPLKDRAFITENVELMKRDEKGVYHCLLVLGKEGDDGILIEAEGYDYARKSAFVPGARQIVNGQPKFQCIAELERRLSGAADKVVSCADSYFSEISEGPYRASIHDLMGQHRFDDRYIPLLVQMLNEHRDDIVFEDIADEIVAYRDQPEQRAETLPGPLPLPFPPERMEQLLDKALDLIGKTGEGSQLYDALKNEVGMTDEEITVAGFDLKEHFCDADADESPGMAMQ